MLNGVGMKINSVNDLIPNTECYITLSSKGNAIKATYLGCVKVGYRCDFYFRFLEKKGYKNGISFFGMDEIGIGNTREEAKEGYGKIKNVLPKIYVDTENEITGLENCPQRHRVIIEPK